MIGVPDLAAAIAIAIGTVVLALGLCQAVIQLAQVGMAALALGSASSGGEVRSLWRWTGEAAPPITLIAPAFNEARSIVESVRSLLNLQYPEFEVVVVNDGSTDGTLAALIEAFELSPTLRSFPCEVASEPVRETYASRHQARLLVVDKPNGGKADALNAGLNLARHPLVCMMDSDSLLEPGALLRAVQPFVDDPDNVVAVGGAIRIVNGCDVEHGRLTRIGLPKGPVALLQAIEYIRAFTLARLAWGHIGALAIISGAFGVFRRDAVIAVGGYTKGTVGEDMELIFKLHRWFLDRRRPYRIVSSPDPVCWTQAPDNLRDLSRQRARWQRGALETFARYCDMLLQPRYGRIGALAMTNVLLTDVVGPLAEVLGYAAIPIFALLGLLSWNYYFAFLALSVGFGVAISVAGLALDETQHSRADSIGDLMMLLCAAILENVGYRQLCNLWRVTGTIEFLRGRSDWAALSRRGFQAKSA